MFENYEMYVVFFLICTIIFTFLGINLRYYSYTGKDLLQIISRIGIIVIVIVLLVWAFSIEIETVEFLVNVCLFVLMPWLLGELLSSVIYRVKYEQ